MSTTKVVYLSKNVFCGCILRVFIFINPLCHTVLNKKRARYQCEKRGTGAVALSGNVQDCR